MSGALALIDLEKELLQAPQVPCPTTHHFGRGVYMREMSAPAGTLILGHAHKYEHMCILLKGGLRVLNQDGTTSDLYAPFIFNANPGRKLALTLSDVSFMNVHPNEDEERDIEKLEERWVTKSDVWSEHQLTAGIAKLKGDV